MHTLLDFLYYQLKKDEIEKASTILKKIEINTIFQSLSKLCWNYNIQWEIIRKTNDILNLKLMGNTEIVLFKYHKTDMVSLEDIDYFMNELDENNAHMGFYITTGLFARKAKRPNKINFNKKDLILEDNFIFIKNNLGHKGKAEKDFIIRKLNFLKYLPR